MLVSTYDPNSEAHCPHCQKVVKCYMIGGITWGFDPYYDFKHDECGTTWRWHRYSGEVESPIPQPMGLRQMMGEENWHQMQWRQHLQSHAEEMFGALEGVIESLTDGDVECLQQVSELVERIRKVGSRKGVTDERSSD